MAIVTDCELRPNEAMSEDRKDIVKRLRVLPEAFGISDAELCRRIKVQPNAWSQYVALKGKRVVTRAVANRLCDEFNLTLDWIYRGKTALVAPEVIKKAREAA